jgi:serine phosphatase RsbU (regulator of sigma subunit)
MASLLSLKGPNTGQRFPITGDRLLIGRQPDADVYLESLAVSRQHACIVRQNGNYFIEDVGSSNGTYLNGQRLTARMPLTERDTVEIGPYTLALRSDPSAHSTETNAIVRARIDASSGSHTLLGPNAAMRLQMVLDIARHLGRHLDLDPLLGQLLDHLFRLFPQADRGMVMLCEGERNIIRAQRTRHDKLGGEYSYSKTIVRKALEEGVGLLSEDVGGDPNLQVSNTMVSLNLRSFLCVPMIGAEEKRLGVIQLDSTRRGQAFKTDDLDLLAALAQQAAVVLENVALHAERVKEARLRQDLLMAREIQQAFLPTDFPEAEKDGYELFARMQPAREVSGDLYDFFRLDDGRLAFFLGDVTGKGMPAALFMIAVRTLIRHLAPAASGPADLLRRLHESLVADNPTNLFVTLAHGIYDPPSGMLTFAASGHPPPLLRRSDGTVAELTIQRTQMLGNSILRPTLRDSTWTLQPAETFVLYTDGFTEAATPDRKQFDVPGLIGILGGERTKLSLEACADAASAAVQRHTGGGDLQDDQTLLLLRRTR